MYLSAEGAKVQSQRLEFIANNLANVETPGFKRDVPTFQARFAEAIQQRQDFPGSKSNNDIGGGVKLIEVDTDFLRRHASKPPNCPPIFAVNGDGFFQVLSTPAANALTRAGDFTVDAQAVCSRKPVGFNVLDDGGGADQARSGTSVGDLCPEASSDQAGSKIAIGCNGPSRLAIW